MIQVTRCKPVIGSDRDYPFLDIAYMRKDTEGGYVAYEDYVKLYNECVELESRIRDQDNAVYGGPYEKLLARRLREALIKKEHKADRCRRCIMSDIAKCPICGEYPRLRYQKGYDCCDAECRTLSRWNQYAAAMELAQARVEYEKSDSQENWDSVGRANKRMFEVFA